MNGTIAVISVMVELESAAVEVNAILHEFRHLVLGRMGLPLREHNINAISVVVEGEQSEINALAGRLGRLTGVSAKALYRK